MDSHPLYRIGFSEADRGSYSRELGPFYVAGYRAGADRRAEREKKVQETLARNQRQEGTRC